MTAEYGEQQTPKIRAQGARKTNGEENIDVGEHKACHVIGSGIQSEQWGGIMLINRSVLKGNNVQRKSKVRHRRTCSEQRKRIE